MTTTTAGEILAPQESETPTGRNAFIAERLTGIGGSDAASVVGLNRWKTNIDLYEEKIGVRAPDDLSDNAAVQWGNRLEDVVAEAYAEETGRTVHRVHKTLRHPQHPFMMAHLDRRVVGEKRGLEVKTAGHWAAQSDQWGAPGTDEVPEQYLIQVSHYMAVTGYEAFDVAVLAGGQDFRIYTVHRNEQLINALIKQEQAFWECVRSQTMPTITDIADAKRLFPDSKAGKIDCSRDPQILDAVLQLREAKRVEKDTKLKIKALHGAIGGFMGEYDTLVRGDQRLLTWKTQDRKEHFVKASTSRVFRLAGESDGDA